MLNYRQGLPFLRRGRTLSKLDRMPNAQRNHVAGGTGAHRAPRHQVLIAPRTSFSVRRRSEACLSRSSRMPTLSGILGAGFFGKAHGKRFCSCQIACTTGSVGFRRSLGADRCARVCFFAGALFACFASCSFSAASCSKRVPVKTVPLSASPAHWCKRLIRHHDDDEACTE